MNLETLLSTLPAPAKRGLKALNFVEIDDFTRVSASTLRSLHGVGPKAVSVIEAALAEKGLALQAWTEGKTVLTDPDIYPGDGVLQHHLAAVKPVFDRMVEEMGQTTPPIAFEWRYYTDGNSWLGKATVKQKTAVWISVCHHMFKATFYFKRESVSLIEQSGLDDQYRPQWEEIIKTGKTKAVTVVVDGPEKLSHVRLLVDIKLQSI